MIERTPLTHAFLEDHRKLMRGLNCLRESLESGDVHAAIDLADELDRTVGAHIEFEEEVLYPQVALSEKREFVQQLYDEHHVGLAAIEQLRRRSAEEPLASEERNRLAADVRTAVEHAASCGTLLSHLTGLDADRQAEILLRLQQLRTEAHRWSELVKRSAPPEQSSGGSPTEA